MTVFTSRRKLCIYQAAEKFSVFLGGVDMTAPEKLRVIPPRVIRPDKVRPRNLKLHNKIEMWRRTGSVKVRDPETFGHYFIQTAGGKFARLNLPPAVWMK